MPQIIIFLETHIFTKPFPIYLKCFQENIWNASSLYYKEVLRTNSMSIHLLLVFIFASVLWPKIWTTHSNFLFSNKRKSSIIFVVPRWEARLWRSCVECWVFSGCRRRADCWPYQYTPHQHCHQPAVTIRPANDPSVGIEMPTHNYDEGRVAPTCCPLWPLRWPQPGT